MSALQAHELLKKEISASEILEISIQRIEEVGRFKCSSRKMFC